MVFRTESLFVIPSESSVSETTRDQREAICLKTAEENLNRFALIPLLPSLRSVGRLCENSKIDDRLPAMECLS